MKIEINLDEVVKQLKKDVAEINSNHKKTGLAQWWNEQMAEPYSLDKIK